MVDVSWVFELPPPKKAAMRYPSGASVIKTVESIPTVVFVEGVRPELPLPPPLEGIAIAQKDTMFRPPLVVVPKGTTIDFPNQDPEFHNVFSYSKPKRFDLGRYPKGESKPVTFDKPGVVKIYCEIHPWMRAVVVVVENPFHTVVGADGRFSLRDVPPGTYTLIAWNVDAGSRKVSVTVPPTGGEVEVNLADGVKAEVPERSIGVAELRGAAGPGRPPEPRPAGE